MIYYTSDLHFDSDFIYELCDRPFGSIQEMNEAMVNNWNETVKDEDTVYFLGDIGQNEKPVPFEYLSRLKGHIHLIRGNHDTGIPDQKSLLSCFETVSDFLETDDGDCHIIMCHYPIIYFQKGYMIHGHVHNIKNQTYEILKTLPQVLNAGVDLNGFRPVTLNQLIENNKNFYSNEELTIDSASGHKPHLGWKPVFMPLPH